jgi:hypothetical protein
VGAVDARAKINLITMDQGIEISARPDVARRQVDDLDSKVGWWCVVFQNSDYT